MGPTGEAFLRSWPSEPVLVGLVALAAAVYGRGWLWLHRRDAARWPVGRLAAYLAGMAALLLALASPLEPFASLLLEVHMIQHLLLMLVAPPLVWLGAPLLPVLRGLPRSLRVVWAARLLRSRAVRGLFARLTHPLVALPIFVGVTWLWHAPRGYELGLRSDAWHRVEHACFLASALVFWYPVVRPYPSRPRWSEWLLLPYLILADVQNTILAAWLTFSSTVIYPHYARVPRLDGLSPLADQAAAGLLMWVPGSIALLGPLFWIGVSLLSGRSSAFVPRAAGAQPGNQLPKLGSATTARSAERFDLLRLPLVGVMLRSQAARRTLQVVLVLLAAAVVLDGLCGPQVSALNLAGVLPWTHWRGVVVLGLLAAGNVCCAACPFTLPRALARRWLPARRRWPRLLRGKWLAVVLVAGFLWSYEALALWDRPWWTAWIIVGYFAAALAVDGWFQDAAFCKYVCPIGQFSFVHSLVSPLEVQARHPSVCVSCRTQDCLRGNANAAGCGTNLLLPRKSGNLDCTFCLDCVRACPQDNVGLFTVVPAQTLWRDRARSGIGRLSRRPDIAALALVLTFGAFANAAGMVGPVVAWQQRFGAAHGLSALWMTSAFYLAWLVLLPAVVICAATWASRRWGQLGANSRHLAARFALALVPLGFGMWLAHYSFHLLTSWETALPAAQRFAADLGWQGLGEPAWACACCRPAGDGILQWQLASLDFGLLLSLYTALRTSEDEAARGSTGGQRAPLRAFAPWGLIIVLLFAVGVWIVFQPMQMRGTLGG